MQSATPLRPLIPLALFNAAYLCVAAVLSLQRQNWEFVYYIVVVAVLAAVVLTVYRRVHLSRGVLWALSAWGFLHMAGGLVPVPDSWPVNGDKYVLYSWWLVPDLLKYDHVLHAYGFGVATWVCWQAVRPALADRLPTFGILTLCVLGGMGLGALNEVVEFAATLLLPDTNIGGYVNTGWDMVANMAGSIAAAVIIGRRERSVMLGA